jgi:hypothetical protein
MKFLWSHFTVVVCLNLFVYLACTELYFWDTTFLRMYFFLSVLIMCPTYYSVLYLTIHECAVRLPLLHVNILLMYLASKQMVHCFPCVFSRIA